MEQLKIYLQNLPVKDRIAFAKRCGTTWGRMQKEISSKRGSFGATQCVRIETESKGAVSRVGLNPEGAKIWPELARGQ